MKRCGEQQAGAVADAFELASLSLVKAILDDDSEVPDSRLSVAKAISFFHGRRSEKKDAWETMKARELWKPVLQMGHHHTHPHLPHTYQ